MGNLLHIEEAWKMGSHQGKTASLPQPSNEPFDQGTAFPGVCTPGWFVQQKQPWLISTGKHLCQRVNLGAKGTEALPWVFVLLRIKDKGTQGKPKAMSGDQKTPLGHGHCQSQGF